jgi:hypothetical protein
MSESQGVDFEQHVKTWRTLTRFIVASVAAVVIVLPTACGTIRSHRQLEQPLGVQLTSPIYSPV